MKSRGSPYSFPKNLRLLRPLDFRRVYDEGRRRSAPLCTVFFRPNGLPQTRLGITVPRTSGGAVVRNRIKRRVREVFRLNQDVIPHGWDVVVNGRKGIIEVPLVQLTRELTKLFPACPPPEAAWKGQEK